MYKAESTLSLIYLCPNSEARQGSFFRSEDWKIMSILRFIFRKDHSSAHWGLRTSSQSWSWSHFPKAWPSPWTWWWPLLSTCQPPYSKQSARVQTLVVCCATVRQSGRAYCLRALLLLYLKISSALTNKFWHSFFVVTIKVAMLFLKCKLIGICWRLEPEDLENRLS